METNETVSGIDARIDTLLGTVHETDDFGNMTLYAADDDELYQKYQTREDACAYWRGCNGCGHDEDECAKCAHCAPDGRGFAWSECNITLIYRDLDYTKKLLETLVDAGFQSSVLEDGAKRVFREVLDLLAEREKLLEADETNALTDELEPGNAD